MLAVFQDKLSEFLTLAVVIDPLGSLPVYLAIVGARSKQDARIIAVHAVIVAFFVLLFFVVAGQLILQQIAVPLTAFQIAGGIVLFLFALSMIFDQAEQSKEENLAKQSPRQAAVFPLAIPAIASPGAMLAVVLITDDARHNVADQGLTVVVIAIILAIQLVLLFLARRIENVIGRSGTSVISRVMGTILAAVAVTEVLDGLSTWLKLPLP
jgi:multiple antibiotic resistance protein